MITLESGQVKPDDKTTIQLVLNSAPQIDHNYSIIINKVPLKTVQKLMENQKDLDRLRAVINHGLPGTNSICCNIKHPDLEDQDDTVVELDPKVLDFIKTAPTVIISKETVASVSIKYEETLGKISEELEKLRKDNEFMKSALNKEEEKSKRQPRASVISKCTTH